MYFYLLLDTFFSKRRKNENKTAKGRLAKKTDVIGMPPSPKCLSTKKRDRLGLKPIMLHAHCATTTFSLPVIRLPRGYCKSGVSNTTLLLKRVGYSIQIIDLNGLG